MNKSIIYYTDNRLPEPIFSIVQDQLWKSELPIVSVSHEMIPFGENYVMGGEPGYVTMLNQIILALTESKGIYVFFCEHDVLYPKSHFAFQPERDDIFYYNEHVWRWDYPNPRLISYDRLFSLSSLCVNRKLAIEHFTYRLNYIEDHYADEPKSKEPAWQRKMGYEPGTKKKKRGGLTDDDFETWISPDPIIDIRHENTFSPRKVRLKDFKHPPKYFEELNDPSALRYWNLQKLFNLWN